MRWPFRVSKQSASFTFVSIKLLLPHRQLWNSLNGKHDEWKFSRLNIVWVGTILDWIFWIGVIQVGIFWVGISQIGIVRVGVILGGNFPGGNHPGSIFPGGSFPSTVNLSENIPTITETMILYVFTGNVKAYWKLHNTHKWKS